MKNMINSLVIGDTSQLSYYFPENYYEKISSRNINFEYYKNRFYDKIYFCFGENRTYIENDINIFLDINVKYTMKLIDFFHDKCNNIIVYGTSELWNNCEAGISIDMEFNFNSSPYIESKQAMVFSIKNSNYKNVIILHPFNFNSVYRKGKFLFGKIFDSILNKRKIEIGDTYFYRDIIHPKYVVERSILAEEDEIIGSGRLTFVNDFIREIYKGCHLKYEDYILEDIKYNLQVKRKIYYLDSKEYKYTNLLSDTINDIKRLWQI